jgi:hypothetical protein
MHRFWCKICGFSTSKSDTVEINPITNQLDDLKARVQALRGYL